DIVKQCLFAPPTVLRQATAPGQTVAGEVRTGTLMLFALDTIRKTSPDAETVFMAGTWAECPALLFVPALYRAVWDGAVLAVHQYDGCKYIMQLSHSGRQMDIPGVHNYGRPNLSSTSKKESLHGFLCKAATKSEIDGLVAAFAEGARRAREAGLDGVELHAAN